MSLHGLRTLFAHLTDAEALETIAREGLEPEVIPAEELRPVVAFAIDYFFRSGCTKAPSPAVLRAEYGDVLDDHEVVVTDPEDSVEWALDDLRATYAHRQAQTFVKDFATAMAEAETGDKVDVLGTFAARLVGLTITLESRQEGQEIREAMPERLRAYEARAADRGRVYGMQFGLDLIDQHTYGIHPGELAVLAAMAKLGKSYMVDRVALTEWRAGKAVVLHTLENSVDMTFDRIGCLATGVDSLRWQRGECAEDEVARVAEFVRLLREGDNPLWVLRPAPGKRTPEHLVHSAQLRAADVLIIDQLSHVEHSDPGRKPRHEIVRDITQRLKVLISSSRHPVPCLLAHQINREGIKASRKAGRLEMEHLAESSEVERSADFVFGMFQSEDMKIARRLLLQSLAARRVDLRHWELDWDVNIGRIRVREEVTLAA